MHRKAEEESHSGVLWATTRTQRGAAWAAHTSSDFGCSALVRDGALANLAAYARPLGRLDMRFGQMIAWAQH
jgi:hypothetical protein